MTVRAWRLSCDWLTSAELAVGGGQEALVTQAAEGSGEVLTAAVETHAGLLALVNV